MEPFPRAHFLTKLRVGIVPQVEHFNDCFEAKPLLSNTVICKQGCVGKGWPSHMHSDFKYHITGDARKV